MLKQKWVIVYLTIVCKCKIYPIQTICPSIPRQPNGNNDNNNNNNPPDWIQHTAMPKPMPKLVCFFYFFINPTKLNEFIDYSMWIANRCDILKCRDGSEVINKWTLNCENKRVNAKTLAGISRKCFV